MTSAHAVSRSMRSLFCGLLAVPSFCFMVSAAEMVVEPVTVELKGHFAQSQLLVRENTTPVELAADLTTTAKYASSNAEVVQVNEKGRLLAVGNGEAVVKVESAGLMKEVKVKVTGMEGAGAVDYTRDIMPILSKNGCNAGACHASQYGKGGFRLSVFSFDPDEDWRSIQRDRAGRRLNPIQPERSLFLRKPLLEVPHGGGNRLEEGSLAHQVLLKWIAQGAPGPAKEEAKVVSLEIFPKRRNGAIGTKQQLRILANYSSGDKVDVTQWSLFDSMDDAVVSVDSDGLAAIIGRGQGPVMVRYRGQAEIVMLVSPYSDDTELPGWQNNNFVDELAAAKFRELGLQPSGLCDDPTFLRRAYLDAIGCLPTLDQTNAFLASTDPNKRKVLIDQLLGLTGDPQQDVHGNAWSAYWALKWADLIRASSKNLQEQGMWSMYNWLKDSMRTNKPFDQFVREMITAQGSVYMSGPANYYRIANNPADLAESTAQIFLGIRLQCAKCHHHPFEKYGQEDYYGLAAFFSRVSTKNSQEFGLFGRESVVMVRSSGSVRHPRTGQVIPPTPLEGEPVDDPLDLRRPLAVWLTSPENKFFARNVVNRYMSYFLGSGLVEPVDDLRATNPPSNPELMDALSEHLVKNRFDVKQLVRVIMNSRLYQLESQPTAQNSSDRRYYSHYLVKRIAAEPLLDAIDVAAGTQTKFKNLPLGTRAIELPDSEYPDYFLNTFGKPRRVITCECERVADPNLAQTLHILNGDLVSNKISEGGGRVAKLVKAKKTHDEIVTELYLASLCRKPRPEELQASQKLLQDSPTPISFYEDLLWALINSKEFLFVH